MPRTTRVATRGVVKLEIPEAGQMMVTKTEIIDEENPTEKHPLMDHNYDLSSAPTIVGPSNGLELLSLVAEMHSETHRAIDSLNTHHTLPKKLAQEQDLSAIETNPIKEITCEVDADDEATESDSPIKRSSPVRPKRKGLRDRKQKPISSYFITATSKSSSPMPPAKRCKGDKVSSSNESEFEEEAALSMIVDSPQDTSSADTSSGSFESNVNSSANSSFESGAGRKCGKCRNHDLDIILKGHGPICPYADCVCALCSLKNDQRSIVTKQARLRRGYKGGARGRGRSIIIRPSSISTSDEGEETEEDDEIVKVDLDQLMEIREIGRRDCVGGFGDQEDQESYTFSVGKFYPSSRVGNEEDRIDMS